MSRILNYIGRVLCLCLPLALPAQNLFVKVGQTYGVSAADDNKRVSDKYAAGADTAFANLYYAWKHWSYQGMSYATFRSTYLGNAIATDVAWRYEGDDNLRKGFQNTFAFGDWTDANGHWMVNRTSQVPRGGIKGQASFGHYNNTQTSQIFATTEFEMDDADWWPANQMERRIFETPNSGLDGYNNNSYNESFTIEGLRLTGPAKYGDGITRVGIFIRRPGECSYMNQVYAQMFQVGIKIVGGVPFTFGTITAFWNENQGVLFEGTWGATITGQVISGDSNGELLGVHPGPDGEAGGILDIRILKHEEGILAENVKAPWRGMITLYIEGQYVANFGSVACSNQYVTIDASIIVNPRLRDGQLQGSILTIGGTKGFNYKTSLRNLASGRRWQGPPENQGRSFKHYAVGDRMIIDDYPTPDPGTPCNCPPLGFFRGNGTFDYAACLPARTGTSTTPPPGTWTCTEWSACNNGTQTRTCTCSGTCTTAKPAESQSCTVTPPPPTMTATASVNNVPAELAKITDGNAGTAWLGKVAMKPGDWILIDYGTVATRSSIAFDIATGYFNGFPGTFEVYVSTNGTSFGNPVKTATGKYPTCEATFTPVSCRYVKMVVKTVNPAGSNWLAISAWR